MFQTTNQIIYKGNMFQLTMLSFITWRHDGVFVAPGASLPAAHGGRRCSHRPQHDLQGNVKRLGKLQ